MVAGGLTRPRTQCTSDRAPLRPANANRTVVPRPEIAPPWQRIEDSLTRSGTRIGILLLVHALANFASWLAGMACRATVSMHGSHRAHANDGATHHAHRPQGIGASPAHEANMPVAAATPRTTVRCTTSDDGSGTRFLGNLREGTISDTQHLGCSWSDAAT